VDRWRAARRVVGFASIARMASVLVVQNNDDYRALKQTPHRRLRIRLRLHEEGSL
jgi:hypothetical protein